SDKGQLLADRQPIAWEVASSGRKSQGRGSCEHQGRAGYAIGAGRTEHGRLLLSVKNQPRRGPARGSKYAYGISGLIKVPESFGCKGCALRVRGAWPEPPACPARAG